MLKRHFLYVRIVLVRKRKGPILGVCIRRLRSVAFYCLVFHLLILYVLCLNPTRWSCQYACLLLLLLLLVLLLSFVLFLLFNIRFGDRGLSGDRFQTHPFYDLLM